jgi:hypothetical protein
LPILEGGRGGRGGLRGKGEVLPHQQIAGNEGGGGGGKGGGGGDKGGEGVGARDSVYCHSCWLSLHSLSSPAVPTCGLCAKQCRGYICREREREREREI